MSNKTFIGKNTQSFETSPEFDSYAGVRIIIDSDTEVVAGDVSGNTGRVLEMQCPWGTQTMARNVLNSLQNFQYQPYTASGALLDPAMELGDGVTVNGTYSGIYTHEVSFSRIMAANISAPQDEAIDHEYPYQAPTDKKIERQRLETKAEFEVQATEIAAKVSKDSPTGQTSFGWRLHDNSWEVFNQSGTILRATSSGLEVKGSIKADSGYIGGSNGFTITANAIYKNISSYGGSQSTGVYIGTNGIQLGQNFKVDSSGNLNASNANFTGAVNCTSLNVASNTGCTIGGSTFSGSSLASCINGGALFNSMISGSYVASHLGCYSLNVGSMAESGNNNAAYWNSRTVCTGTHSVAKSFYVYKSGNYAGSGIVTVNEPTFSTIWYLGHP